MKKILFLAAIAAMSVACCNKCGKNAEAAQEDSVAVCCEKAACCEEKAACCGEKTECCAEKAECCGHCAEKAAEVAVEEVAAE